MKKILVYLFVQFFSGQLVYAEETGVSSKQRTDTSQRGFSPTYSLKANTGAGLTYLGFQTGDGAGNVLDAYSLADQIDLYLEFTIKNGQLEFITRSGARTGDGDRTMRNVLLGKGFFDARPTVVQPTDRNYTANQLNIKLKWNSPVIPGFSVSLSGGIINPEYSSKGLYQSNEALQIRGGNIALDIPIAKTHGIKMSATVGQIRLNNEAEEGERFYIHAQMSASLFRKLIVSTEYTGLAKDDNYNQYLRNSMVIPIQLASKAALMIVAETLLGLDDNDEVLKGAGGSIFGKFGSWKASNFAVLHASAGVFFNHQVAVIPTIGNALSFEGDTIASVGDFTVTWFDVIDSRISLMGGYNSNDGRGTNVFIGTFEVDFGKVLTW